MPRCPSCSTENREGRKFCSACGTALALVCGACGTANEPDERFCGECGSSLTAEAATVAAAPETVQAHGATVERRVVSVLFADLVGFTTLSEGRDSEEVRELLSRYFETARTLIERYGGTVEKFIGDAVMAVWGTPVVTEDDAERAVRAALDLVASIAELGDELGVPELRARAGVLTGEAAATVGATGQGMVAGDLVNTASRVQSAAPPGAVYVGESTRRAAEETVVFEDAGMHELKGKAEPVALFRAVRVVSGLGGSLRSQGLEAPFVGRDRELRQIKDLYHASAEEEKAHLVSVTGIAGIGKSRLAWEFYKYFDGLSDTIYWHRGRCLAYGEGVAYWALADMVRMRCRIAEDEEPASALEKLREIIAEHSPDEEERQFLEPRLAHLLGLVEHDARDKQDLFAAWRVFFERLAAVYPTVLAFEDMQWADASLLDFIEYLVEWSRSHRLYIVTLARPDLIDRRPTWGAGKRNFTSLYLEPLAGQAMTDLLGGLVPGLPPALRDRILTRAEGVPLYAVETVRMLLDRGALVQDGPVYRPAAEIDTLDVPETLHALIAARLDGLSVDERRVLQDGAVLGKTFTPDALTALSGVPGEELEPVLVGLVRKEVLSQQSDPRSPEHGQFGFLQDLVRRVAYEMLSHRERKAKHLAAAAHLESAFPDEDEVVEVVASHYLLAYEIAPDAEDAPEIRARAESTLVRAGARAESLAASTEAQRYFEQAAGLAGEPAVQAGLLDRAGQMAWKSGDAPTASPLFERAISLYTELGDVRAAARTSARLGMVDSQTGKMDRSLERLERSHAVLAPEGPSEDLAMIEARLASAFFFKGDHEAGLAHADLALELGESLRLPEIMARALISRAMLLGARGRSEEACALLTHAARIALENDLPTQTYTSHFNLSDLEFRRDRYADALATLEGAHAAARRGGDRLGEWEIASERTYPLFMLGGWQEALAAYGEIPEDQIRIAGTLMSPLTTIVEIFIHRGDLAAARHVFSLYERLKDSTDVQDQCGYAGGTAALRRAEGEPRAALEAGREAMHGSEALGLGSQAVKQGFVEAAEAAFELGELTEVDKLLELVDGLAPGYRPPYLEAQVARFHARLERERGGDPAPRFASAVNRFRELGVVFWLGVTQLERAEWLVDAGRSADAVAPLDEAREIFERLEARPWLERAGRVSLLERATA